jgi:hypothetical protein
LDWPSDDEHRLHHALELDRNLFGKHALLGDPLTEIAIKGAPTRRRSPSSKYQCASSRISDWAQTGRGRPDRQLGLGRGHRCAVLQFSAPSFGGVDAGRLDIAASSRTSRKGGSRAPPFSGTVSPGKRCGLRLTNLTKRGSLYARAYQICQIFPRLVEKTARGGFSTNQKS